MDPVGQAGSCGRFAAITPGPRALPVTASCVATVLAAQGSHATPAPATLGAAAFAERQALRSNIKVVGPRGYALDRRRTDSNMPLSQEEVHVALTRWHGWIASHPETDPGTRIRDYIALRQRVLVANDMTADSYDDLIEMVVDERFISDRIPGESDEIHAERVRGLLRRARENT